jgi:hypothetical protein
MHIRGHPCVHRVCEYVAPGITRPRTRQNCLIRAGDGGHSLRQRNSGTGAPRRLVRANSSRPLRAANRNPGSRVLAGAPANAWPHRASDRTDPADNHNEGRRPECRQRRPRDRRRVSELRRDRVGPGVAARDPSFQPDVRFSRIRLTRDCALMRARAWLDGFR